MGRMAVLAACALNQWALDYQGNMERIIAAIQRAKAAGARYVCGTELNIVGYSCGDHYHERDTEMHAWEVLALIMQHSDCNDIMVDVGLPVMHKNVIYNCKLVFLNREVLLIRPKMILANDGSMGYRETRWFTAWVKTREVEDYRLPSVITKISGQMIAPFGDAVIETKDTTVGYDICEELWNPESCHLSQCLDGAEIISNGLGSLEVYGQPGLSYQMVQMATMKSGGCYLLANQKGCDGGQGYYEGDTCIGLNGNIVAYSTLYNLEEVDVITATVDLESIRRYKASIRSRCFHAAKTKPYPRIKVDFSICNEDWWTTGIPSCSALEPVIPTQAEQILKVPACWLWDYLRRSECGGFLLPLSGDVDSSATAAIVFSMCHLVVEAVATGNDKVLEDVRRLVGQNDYVPRDAQELCGHLVYTLYDETSSLSLSSSLPKAKEIVNELSQQIGSHHSSVNLDGALDATVKSLAHLRPTNTSSKHQEEMPLKHQEDMALEYLRSRMAMAISYFFAESGMVSKNHKGDLIVLASSNVDNTLSGSGAKYGRTYGDINLIGRFPKGDIIKFLHLAKDRLKLPVLEKIQTYSDADEEMATYGYLQSIEGCGPSSMFQRLWSMWRNDKTPKEINKEGQGSLVYDSILNCPPLLRSHKVAEKVKEFFRAYNLHRRKMVGLPPVFYMPSTGPPDDLRPLFYPKAWHWQFRDIDETIKKMGNYNDLATANV